MTNISDFQKAVCAIRGQGMVCTVENFEGRMQVATIEGDGVTGGFATNVKALLMTEDELMIIRELLSFMACGYERATFDYHCCDANEIVKKIDDLLGVPKEQ